VSAREAAPLAIKNAVLDGERIGLRCAGGRIAALGVGVEPRVDEPWIDAEGANLASPLLNGHTHAAMTLFRGRGGNLPLMRWLRERIWPVEAELGAEDVYWGTRLACLEMIRTVTTRFWDMYWQPLATARAVRDAGLKAMIGGPFLDAGVKRAATREAALEDLGELQSLPPRQEPYSLPTQSMRLAKACFAGALK
jgi:5-methylthioadenosine/S-adenosylhomocysteine deaminase